MIKNVANVSLQTFMHKFAGNFGFEIQSTNIYGGISAIAYFLTQSSQSDFKLRIFSALDESDIRKSGSSTRLFPNCWTLEIYKCEFTGVSWNSYRNVSDHPCYDTKSRSKPAPKLTNHATNRCDTEPGSYKWMPKTVTPQIHLLGTWCILWIIFVMHEDHLGSSSRYLKYRGSSSQCMRIILDHLSSCMRVILDNLSSCMRIILDHLPHINTCHGCYFVS